MYEVLSVCGSRIVEYGGTWLIKNARFLNCDRPLKIKGHTFLYRKYWFTMPKYNFHKHHLHFLFPNDATIQKDSWLFLVHSNKALCFVMKKKTFLAFYIVCFINESCLQIYFFQFLFSLYDNSMQRSTMEQRRAIEMLYFYFIFRPDAPTCGLLGEWHDGSTLTCV